MKVYANKDGFYTERGGRWSGELDYGVWHVDDIGVDAATRSRRAVSRHSVTLGGHPAAMISASGSGRYTVSLVEDTGDVYAWRDDDTPLALIANLPGTPESRRDTAEKLLSGWAKICPGRGMGKPLSWFVGRLADHIVDSK